MQVPEQEGTLMGWRSKGDTPTRLPRAGKGVSANRECANCQPPCQGGEVLHRRGYCCHSYCDCEAFEPKGYPHHASLPEVLLKKAGMGRGPAG